MAQKMKNIYEYFEGYTEQEINDMVDSLQPDDKELVMERYGSDFHNPKTSDNFTKEKRVRFYSHLVPKMRELLAVRRLNNVENSISKKDNSDLKSQLIDLIKLKKSNEEICDTLEISKDELYKLLLDLKNNGIIINRNYYSDGSIQYKLVHCISDLKKVNTSDQSRAIITDSKENEIKVLVISDLHFGNKYERLDLVNRAFNYCKKKGINIILSGGDLIDGKFSKSEQIIANIYDQVEYFIKNYPSDKNIITFGVLGNHDFSVLTSDSICLKELCNNLRHDVVIVGYNNALVNIKNDSILLYHYINSGSMFQTNAPLILQGHLHKYTTLQKDSVLNVTLPALSDINQSLPTALELTLNFKKGYMDDVVIKQIYFGDKDIVLGEATFNLLTNRSVTNEPIKFIEAYKNDDKVEPEKKLVKSLDEVTQLSQIDKFKRRYNIK